MLTAERARTLFTYDPESGALCRRPETVDARNRSRMSDQVRTLDKDGYLVVKIDGKVHAAHRVIFLMMTGRWPQPTVDRGNRIRTDNRWSNLKEASHAENSDNRGSFTRFAVPHVYKTMSTGRYVARAFIDGRQRRLGTYDTPEEASAAVARAKAGAA